MSRLYAVTVTGTITVAGGDFDILALAPAVDKPIALAGWSIGQTTKKQDAQEELYRFDVVHLPATVTDGTGGTAVAAANIVNVDDPAGTAAGFTGRQLDSAIATTLGTLRTPDMRGWNERASPYDFFYPEDRFMPRARNGQRLILRGQTTIVTPDITVVLTAWVVEQ